MSRVPTDFRIHMHVMKRWFGTAMPTTSIGNPIAITYAEWIEALNRIMAFIRGYLN